MATHTNTRFRHLSGDNPVRSRLETLRSSVQPLLATELLLHFTDHSVDHSDRVAGFVDELISPIQEGNRALQENELAALYAACYLHDLGMHVEAVSELSTVSSRLMGESWNDLSKEAKEKFIRSHHHRISAELVCLAAKYQGPCSILPVNGLFPEEIALLCAIHQLDLDVSDQQSEYSRNTEQRKGLRMDLLGAVIRIADILDDTQFRACREKAKILCLPANSQSHWWHHYYTEHISVDRGAITIEFEFPANRRADYERVVPCLQVPLIQEEVRRHEGVLTAHGLMRSVTYRVIGSSYDAKEAMPDSVYLAMAAELQHRELTATDRRRLAALEYLRHTRSAAKRQFAELEERKALIPAADYIEQAWQFMKSLHDVGGIRSARVEFDHAYSAVKNSLPARQKMDYGLRLATWQIKDYGSFLAIMLLQELMPLVQDLATDDPLKFTYYRQKFLALYDLAIHYKEATEAGRQAVAIALSKGDRDLMVADLIEMAFLLGEPGDALGYSHEFGVLDTGALRTRMLGWRLKAMAGGVDAVLDILTKLTWTTAHDVAEEASVLLLKAELFYFEGRFGEALAVFRNELWPKLESLPAELSGTCVACYQSVSMQAQEKESLAGFYDSVDERNFSEISREDQRNSLHGLDAAEADKHYDAMAYLARAARTAYCGNEWFAFQWSCARLARECVKVNFLRDAVFYGLLSHDDKVVKVVVAALRNSRQPEKLGESFMHLLKFAHLATHAKTACDIFGELADELPDHLLPEVLKYLLAKTRVCDKAMLSPWEASRAAWKALGALMPRFDTATTERVADAVIAFPDWSKVGITRMEKIQVLTHAVPKLTHTKLRSLAELCLPLVTTGKFDYDFRESWELVCDVAERSDVETKHAMAKVLYPSGAFCDNGLLLGATELFDVDPNPEELSTFAARVLTRLQGQVRVLAPETEVPATGGATVTRVVQGKKNVTYESPAIPLWGLSRHFEELPEQTRKTFAEALLASLSNPEDSVQNKVTALELIPILYLHVSSFEKNAITKQVLTLAENEQSLPSGATTPEDAANPLQRFRISMGGPADIIAAAIHCLAMLEEAEPGAIGPRLSAVFEHALTHNDPKIRRFTFRALQHRVSRTRTVMDKVVLGTRDDNPVTAAAAFYVITRAEAVELDPIMVGSILYSLSFAARSSETRLRKAASAVVAKLSRFADAEHQPVLARLKDQLAADQCFSVREALCDTKQ